VGGYVTVKQVSWQARGPTLFAGSSALHTFATG